MRALVTGALGFAGRHLCEYLKSCGDTVLGTRIPGEAIDASIETEPLDVQDSVSCAKLVQDFQPDAVYHLAGIAFVPEAERDFERAVLVNSIGTYNMCKPTSQLSKETGFVLISSAEVYGKFSQEELPLHEGLTPRPANNYSASKLMAEVAITRFSYDSKHRAVSIRAFNHIGPRQNTAFVVASFANQLAQIAKKKSPPVMRVGNLDAKRDFIDVRDIVRGYRVAALKGRGIYNMCSGTAHSIQSILDTLIEISGLAVTIERDPSRMRPADTPEIRGSFAKAHQELGWRPELSIKQSLHDIYHYYLARES